MILLNNKFCSMNEICHRDQQQHCSFIKLMKLNKINCFEIKVFIYYCSVLWNSVHNHRLLFTPMNSHLCLWNFVYHRKISRRFAEKKPWSHFIYYRSGLTNKNGENFLEIFIWDRIHNTPFSS